MTTITLSADQRNALYAQIRPDLLAVDDLRLVVECDDLVSADKLGRQIAGQLRLIAGGLGWKDKVTEPVDLSLPADELRSIFSELRDRAIALHGFAKEEQEAFRAPIERAALVRDTCEEALARLSD